MDNVLRIYYIPRCTIPNVVTKSLFLLRPRPCDRRSEKATRTNRKWYADDQENYRVLSFSRRHTQNESVGDNLNQ